MLALFEPLLAEDTLKKQWPFATFWKTRLAEINVAAAESDRKKLSQKVCTLKDTTLFRSWLPETDLQQDPAVVAERTVLCSLLPQHGWPWKAICVLCDFVCAEHINCTHYSERTCASLHPGFHSEQSSPP